MEPFDVARAHRVELRALLELRDLRARAAHAPRPRRSRTPPSSPSSAAGCATATPATSPATGRSTATRYRRTGRTDPETRRGTDGPDHAAERCGCCATIRSGRSSRAGELRRQHPDRDPGDAPLRAGRRAPRAAAGRRHAAGRARDLPRHPRPRRARGDRIGCSAQDPTRRARGSASSSTTTPPQAGWCPRPSTSPATCAPSSTRPARPPAERHVAPGQRRGARAGAARRPRRPRRSSRGSAPRGSTPTTHRQFLAELLEDPDRRGRASRRRDLGGQGPQPDRSRRPASGAPAGWTRWRSPRR